MNSPKGTENLAALRAAVLELSQKKRRGAVNCPPPPPATARVKVVFDNPLLSPSVLGVYRTALLLLTTSCLQILISINFFLPQLQLLHLEVKLANPQLRNKWTLLAMNEVSGHTIQGCRGAGAGIFCSEWEPSKRIGSGSKRDGEFNSISKCE